MREGEIRAFAFIIALVWAPIASSVELLYSQANSFSGEIGPIEALVVRGEIGPGDYEYFLDVIRRDP